MNDSRSSRIRVLSECGMLLATALALSSFKLFQLPSGGSISLGPLPLLLIAARHGTRTGIISGALLGILMLVNRPFIVHPLQFLLDYPLAFASLGLAGIFEWKSPLNAATATTVANFVRLQFHVVAGAVFFVTSPDSLYQGLTISLAYNLGHILPETIICVVLASVIAQNHQAICERQNKQQND